ncbi:unnamed protein product [Mytilus coruscus]|uniref:CCHC-type domain-containing protein n=1 Tax=Mytilus coruscus TaxID=42192 RepID=A0A6J8ABD4_MYTCO|nr:unnamed protein product [Mytilus coruscus]
MERARGYTIKINTCPEVVLKCMPGIGDAIGNRIMDIRNKGIHIDREVLEQIPYLRVTEGLLGMIDFESIPTRENAGAGHPSIPFVDKDRQSTPIFSPLCVETHEDRDAPLHRECSDPAIGISEAYGDSPYFRPIPAHQHEENKQKIAEMCNFGNKVSNWIEEHHANRDTTLTCSYKAKLHLKSIEQPDFRQTISPIEMQSVLESEIEKVSGEIECLLGELGHLSDVSDRDSLTPSPRTNMVVQHQQEQQHFADSLQRQQVLDLSTHSHDIRLVENQQVPPVANFQQIDQQGINRPQPVNNSHQQDILPVTTDEMPSDHVLHFPPSVRHENIYRQQDQQVASHLQQASLAYHRSPTSENPVKQHRDIYKPETPTVERVQPFPPPIQHDDYHRQPEFNKYIHQTSSIHSPPPISNKLVEHQQPIHHVSQQHDFNKYQPERLPSDHVHFSPSAQHTESYLQQGCNRQQQDSTSRQFQPSTQGKCSTALPSTNQYQLSINNIQSGVNRVQQPTVQSQTYVPSHQQVPQHQIGSTNQQPRVNKVQQPMLPVQKGVQLQQQVQGLHQRLAQLQLGFNNYAQPIQQQNPAAAPVSLPQQQPNQQLPVYQRPGYQPPRFVPRTQPPIMIGHPTSMFQPPRGGPPPQGPTQSFHQQNVSSVAYPVVGQPTFSGPPDTTNYQPQSHTLPVQQHQPPSSEAPPAHNNQPPARRKEYDSDYHERQRRRDPGRYYTADSDTSDASPYRQTRNKRRSAPAYLSDHSHRDSSPIRSARTSPAHSRHSSRRSLTARESQSESEMDSRHSRSQSKKTKKIEKRQFLSSIPKTLRYSGKCNWKAFYTKQAVSAIQKPGKPGHESSSEKPGTSPVVLGVGSSKSSMDTRLSRIEEHIERMMSTVTSLAQEKSVRQGTSPSSRSPNRDNRPNNYSPRRNYGRGRGRGNNSGDRRQNQRGYNNDCYYCHKPGHYKRNCPELRQNNNRQQSKQLTPKKNTKEERRVEFDDDNFIQDDSEENSSKGVSVGTLGTAHLLRCIVRIQDKEVNALIDTGSEVTILKDSVFETLAQKPYIIRETTMHGAGRDMLMTCRITNPVEFSIQHLTFNERLYVAPIDCDMLLGADFLIKHSAILDVPAKKLTLKNTVVQLLLGGEPTPVPMVNRVTVQETIIIPPNTALRINLNTEDVTSDYLIEPKGNSTLLIPRTVCAKRQKPTLCFLNITDHPVKLPKGDEVGYTQEVSVIQSLEDEPLPSVGTCTANSSKPGIPSHLKDLYADSGSNLSKSQQTLLKQLLINHGDLFSTPEPETLAPPQAPDNNQDVSALPDVTCNPDLTVSTPTQKQQEVNDTWFSTHIELICTPTTAQIIASDQNSCHVAAVTQSEGINFSGFSTDEIKTRHMATYNQGKVDGNNNKTTVSDRPSVGRGMTVEREGKTYYRDVVVSSVEDEQVSEEAPQDSQYGGKTPPEAMVADVSSMKDELTRLVVTLKVPEVPTTSTEPPQSGANQMPAYYVCPRSKTGERTWVVSQKDQYCPVRGCPVVTRNVRRHVLAEHLTFMFDSKQDPSLMRQRRFHQYRGQMVMVLAQWLTRKEDATYEDLHNFLRHNSRVPSGYPQSGEEMPVFRSVCREMGWPTSAWFRIQPALQISSPVCVLHWRVMATLVHRLPPSRQDILATEKYSPEDNGLDLVHLHAWNRQFFKVEPVVEVVPAAVVKEVAGEAPQQEEAFEDPKQEEAIAAPRQQEEEIPMEDRHIIILQNGLEKRMVPVCSLRDLRSIAKERFPGRGEVILQFQGMVLDPLITVRDILQMEAKPTIEVSFSVESTQL